jgi:phosphohistidine phosphatase
VEGVQHRHVLIVMRHAKAGELPGGPDAERPLRSRGQRDSAAAGQWLARQGFLPGAVICSAALRTRQTWQHLSASLGGDPAFSAEPGLYGADADEVVEAVRDTPEDVRTLMYIGHNPAAASLVGILTGAEPDFPTAAIAVIGLRAAWAELSAGDGEAVASWRPSPGR